MLVYDCIWMFIDLWPCLSQFTKAPPHNPLLPCATKIVIMVQNIKRQNKRLLVSIETHLRTYFSLWLHSNMHHSDRCSQRWDWNDLFRAEVCTFFHVLFELYHMDLSARLTCRNAFKHSTAVQTFKNVAKGCHLHTTDWLKISTKAKTPRFFFKSHH